MEQAENVQKVGTEASVSLSTVYQRRRPMLHYVSENKEEDTHDVSLPWTHNWLSGWFLRPTPKDTQQGPQRFDELSAIRRRGLRHRALNTPRSRTASSLVDEEVIYAREDFLRLQAECIHLKLNHEKYKHESALEFLKYRIRLLEHAHAADLEMEMYVLNVIRVLERNNAALRDTTERLESSEGMIIELKALIAQKDAEIEKLRRVADDAHAHHESSTSV